MIAEEIIKQKDAEIETLIGILKRIVASAPACSCIDAYRLRRLTDPTCARCNGADVDEAIEWLKRVEGGE